MKKTHKKAGIYSLMLKNYLLFTFVTIIAILILMVFSAVRIVTTINRYERTSIADNLSLFENRNYSAVPVNYLFGDNSFFIILDDCGKQVYSSNEKQLELTENDLFYVPEYDKDVAVTATKIVKDDGHKNYSLDYHTKENVDKEIYIWNEDLNLVYSSSNLNVPPMTEKLFLLLSNKYYENYSIHKFYYTDQMSSKTYTILIFSDLIDMSLLSKFLQAITDSLLLLVVIYVLVMITFSWWLRRKIAKPLTILQTNMNSYEVGNKIETTYKGPREFCDIFESYKNMAVRLEESENRRKALEEEKRNMLAGVAHDLKTPITVIMGYAEALRDGVIPKEKQPQYESVIAQKAKKLSELINAFYDFSKMDHSGYFVNKDPENICSYFRNYIADRYTELQNAGFEPFVEIPETRISVSIDKMQLKRVFDNILDNAVKHNEKGTTLYFILRPLEDEVKIILGDSGCGIPEELRATIFEPFVMSASSQKKNGSGLGLAVAKRIVEAHDGRIALLSNVDQMSTAFEIVLPMNK